MNTESDTRQIGIIPPCRFISVSSDAGAVRVNEIKSRVKLEGQKPDASEMMKQVYDRVLAVEEESGAEVEVVEGVVPTILALGLASQVIQRIGDEVPYSEDPEALHRGVVDYSARLIAASSDLRHSDDPRDEALAEITECAWMLVVHAFLLGGRLEDAAFDLAKNAEIKRNLREQAELSPADRALAALMRQLQASPDEQAGTRSLEVEQAAKDFLGAVSALSDEDKAELKQKLESLASLASAEERAAG